MTGTADVAIIGGGAAGCAVAYYLGKAGIGSVVVERAGIANQASGFNAGGLNPLQGAGIPGPLSALAAESFRMHAELAEPLEAEAGVRYHYKRIASLNVALTDEDIPALRETHDIFGAAEGFKAQWLTTDELLDIQPLVSQSAVCGLYAYGNASLDGRAYTQALWRAAERMGAGLRDGAATGLQTAGGRVTGVLLDDGDTLSCDAVVIATGPWSAQMGEWLGVRIPVEPLKGEIVRLRLSGELPQHDLAGAGVSLYARNDGLLWVGATEEWCGFDAEPSESARRTLLDGAANVMPSLANSDVAEVALHTACLRPVTADWLPIIDTAPGWDNAYLATGAGRKGILLSPGMGKAVADLITQGETSVAVDGFDAKRFE